MRWPRPSLGLAAAAILVVLQIATPVSANLLNTTLASACTSNKGCLSPSTFCDLSSGVCALSSCTLAKTGLACSLFNSTTYCTSLKGTGSCATRLDVGTSCSPSLEKTSGLLTIPGVNGDASNEQCIDGLTCDTATNACKTDGALGWVRYNWTAHRSTLLAVAAGVVLLLFCLCFCGCWMCGCAAVSSVCCIGKGVCSCASGLCDLICCCCSGSDKKKKRNDHDLGGGASSSAAAPHAAVPARPNDHINNNGGGGYDDQHHPVHSAQPSTSAYSARPVDAGPSWKPPAQSDGYAGRIVNVETTEDVVTVPLAPIQHQQPPMAMGAPSGYGSVPPPQQYHQQYQQQQQPPQYGYMTPAPASGSYGSVAANPGNYYDAKGSYGIAPPMNPYAAAGSAAPPMQQQQQSQGYPMAGGSSSGGGAAPYGYTAAPAPGGGMYPSVSTSGYPPATTAGYAGASGPAAGGYPAVSAPGGYGQPQQPQQQQQASYPPVSGLPPQMPAATTSYGNVPPPQQHGGYHAGGDQSGARPVRFG
ncbi:hypothetical protein BC828DRAFT_407401 [Blastocladiella britannica]|nr:hypothetical protein BC828DRAFT_407401 [Blastocladiella britannica]